jgi:hypothetical protein
MKLHEGQKFQVMSEVYTIQYVDRSSDMVVYSGLDGEQIVGDMYKVQHRIKLGIWTEIKQPKVKHRVVTLIEVEPK